MPEYTVAELAKKIGKKPSYLYVYKKRGKIIIEDGKINDNIPLNAAFIQKKLAEIDQKNIELEPEKSSKNHNNRIKSDDIDTDLQQKITFQSQLSDKLKNEKLQEELEITRIKKKKLLGEVVPTDQVKILFNTHFRNVSIEFYNAIDGYTTIMIKKIGGDRNDLAEIRVKLKELVNQFVQKAKTRSKDDIQSIINEFSEKKGRGESD